MCKKKLIFSILKSLNLAKLAFEFFNDNYLYIRNIPFAEVKSAVENIRSRLIADLANRRYLVVPHTFLQSMILPATGLTGRFTGFNRAVKPMFRTEGIWPAYMVLPSSCSVFHLQLFTKHTP